MRTHSAAVITVSDRSAAGVRADTAGPLAVAALREAGFDCPDAVIVADGVESVASALGTALDAGARVVVTTGGTGLSRRDQTPEGTLRVLDRQLPGIAEDLRRRGTADTPMALLSRGVAGVAGRALIVNLPGSPKAVESGMPVIVAVATHALGQLEGHDH